jgi:hypothetical protein
MLNIMAESYQDILWYWVLSEDGLLRPVTAITLESTSYY